MLSISQTPAAKGAHLLPQQPVGYVARLMYAGALNHNSLWKYVHVTDGCRCSES